MVGSQLNEGAAGPSADLACLDRIDEAADKLAEVSSLVDDILQAVLAAGLADQAIGWSDASHCLHRALIALGPPAGSDVFVG
jgi:hypothetical protein